MSADTVELGAAPLTLADVVGVARHSRRATVGKAAVQAMRASEKWLDDLISEMEAGRPVGPIYSVNTGFGSLAGRQAFRSVGDASELSRRLILSNASGVGRYFDQDVVRAAMVIRAASLTRGYSAVRPELPELITRMLAEGVYPAIPEYGSLGASGDLIPLAHLAIVMTRPDGDDVEEDSGEAFVAGSVVSGLAAMRTVGLGRITLRAKEGLALTNGTSFSTAQVALALADALNLIETAEITAAMSIEAMMGFGDAFIPQIHEARGHRGQIESAANIRQLLSGSQFIDGEVDRDPVRRPPQDAYSLRCTPQVLGAVRDTLRFVQGIVETEINAATDNPLVFPDLPDRRTLKAVSGGNFHAEYLAFAADFLGIAVTELGNIAERPAVPAQRRDAQPRPSRHAHRQRAGRHGLRLHAPAVPRGLARLGLQNARAPRQRRFHPHVRQQGRSRVDGQQRRTSRPADRGQHRGCHRRRAPDGRAGAQGFRLAGNGADVGALSAASRAALDLLRSTTAADGRLINHITQDVVLYPRVRAAVNLVHDAVVVEAVRATRQQGAP